VVRGKIDGLFKLLSKQGKTIENKPLQVLGAKSHEWKYVFDYYNKGSRGKSIITTSNISGARKGSKALDKFQKMFPDKKFRLESKK
jgi:hypothetical protein